MKKNVFNTTPINHRCPKVHMFSSVILKMGRQKFSYILKSLGKSTSTQ